MAVDSNGTWIRTFYKKNQCSSIIKSRPPRMTWIPYVNSTVLLTIQTKTTWKGFIKDNDLKRRELK